jgi:hypothetical protein
LIQPAPTFSRKKGSCCSARPFFRLFTALFIISLPRAAPALDAVHLKDGTVQEGQVIELGRSSIDLAVQGGSKKILKKDIERVEFDPGRHAAETQTSDGIIKKGGHTIRGNVELLEGGQKVQVTLPGGSKAVFPRKDVLRILKRGEAIEHDTTSYTAELGKEIEGAISRLENPSGGSDEKSVSADEKFLSSCGILAIAPVRRALPGTDTASAGGKALRKVDRLYRLKESIAPELEEAESNLYEVLTNGTAQAKCDLLVFLFPRFVEESVPLAAFLAMDPLEAPLVRAWSVDFLRRMQKNRELLNIYKASTGQVQMAAAVALGKNRILIGVPTLLEGLELEPQNLRELAAKHLRELTGEDFQFRSDGSPQARKEALQRWRVWWEKNEGQLSRQAEKVLREGGAETKERVAAIKLWKEAGEALEKKNIAGAEAALRKAIQTDPSFTQAHVGLAVLLYKDLGKPQEAARILGDLKTKHLSASAKDEDRQWVYLYLGHSLRLSGDLDGAADAYRQCLAHSRDNLQATLALGEVNFLEATSQKDLKPEERKAKLQSALASYQAALSRLEKFNEELTTLRFEELPAGMDLPFDRRDYNRSVLDLRKSYRRQKEEAQFQAAKLMALLGEQKEALILLRRALDDLAVDPPGNTKKLEAEIRTYLGLLYEELGQPVVALREFRKVIGDLDAKNQEAQEGVKRLRRSQGTKE